MNSAESSNLLPQWLLGGTKYALPNALRDFQAALSLETSAGEVVGQVIARRLRFLSCASTNQL